MSDEIRIQHLLAIAVQHQQVGQLEQAEATYREILVREPQHAQALHLLGCALYQKGEQEVGIEVIQNALSINPNIMPAHSNLGLMLQDRQRLQEAEAVQRFAL